MSFCIFLLYYIVCTSIVLLVSLLVFKKYYANKLLSKIINEAFDNNDIDTDIENLTDTLNDMNDSQNPKFF